MGTPIRRRARGQALVETALVLPVFILLLLAVFDFGRAIYAYNTLSNAARAGARVAIVDQNPVPIAAKAMEQTIGMNPDEVDVDLDALTTACTTNPPKIGCPVTVTVTYGWSAITPVIGNLVGRISLSSTTSMPIERVHVSP